MRGFGWIRVAGVVVAFVSAVAAQSSPVAPPPPPESPDAVKAAGVLEAATAALGGPRYLAVKSQVSTGVFTGFVQGHRGAPVDFIDTFVFPDRNRTEFGKKKTRVVQTNTGDTGWKFDAQRDMLAAQTPEEVALFKRYIRANLDNVLRGLWRSPDAQLEYLGKIEMAPRQWSERVALTYGDGLRVELFFDLQTHLPTLTRYFEGAESGAPGSVLETRYYFFLDHGGIKAPRTVDLYRDNVQTARVVYDTVAFNAPVEPQVFEKPATAKDLK
jgi:hypothetical protein